MRDAQVWYGDFLVAVVIFISAVMVFWTFQERYQPDENSIEQLSSEALNLGNILNTQGFPADWSETNVTRVGITNGNNRINDSKVLSLARMDYNLIRSNANVLGHFYLYFELTNGSIVPINSTVAGIGRYPNGTVSLVETKRLVIKDSEFTKMVIRIWN